MNVITLHQPWASFILFGWKTIETRTHHQFAGLVHQRIGIHASLEYDYKAHLVYKKYLSQTRKGIFLNIRRDISNTMLGKILCTVYVTSARFLNSRDSKRALIDCSNNDRYGLILKDMIPLDPPIPATGQQGIWTYENGL